ncbi:MAG: membrane protease YdiL (CAAX protease family) [Flavobacteriaceae bacterium]|jgi:membrane protease YdiL (CAAX protease family)
MQFVQQYQKGESSASSFILTIALTLFSLVIGNTIAAGIVLGFDLDMLSEDATMDKSLILFLLIIPFICVLGTLMFCVKYIHKRKVVSLFTARSSFDWKRFFLAFLLYGFILTLSLIYAIVAGVDIAWNFNPSTFIPLLLVALLILPLQTAAEDALFRGFLFQGFGKLFKHAGISVLLTGTMFGLLHIANPEVAKLGYGLLIYYISTGIFLGILTHMDDGMELGMGYHAINNIFAAVILTNDWQAFTTDALFIDRSAPAFGWESILTLIILQPLLILIFSRIYKWKNWRKKLIDRM